MLVSIVTFVLACSNPVAQTADRGKIASVSPAQVLSTVEKSLQFLEMDVARWRKKTDCATCHHGAMTAVAYSEAKIRGFAVPDETLNDTLNWTKARFVPVREEKPNLSNGFEIPSLAIPILALASWTKPDALSPDEIDRMAKFTMDRQQPDGGWVLQPRPPHPVFESREVLTIWLYLSLEASSKGDGEQSSSSRLGRERALALLAKAAPADTTQVSALRMLVDIRSGLSQRKLQPQIEALFRRQNADGGWSQTRELGSDAYATGQALYALSLAGVRAGRKEMRRGVSFLVATQRKDGSWTMIPRETPERKASKNLEPINHFAAAWATMGLVRSIAPPSAVLQPSDKYDYLADANF